MELKMSLLAALQNIEDSFHKDQPGRCIHQLVEEATGVDHKKAIFDLLEDLWPDHSGVWQYPISGGLRDPNPLSRYMLKEGFWDRRTTYGRNRFSALRFLIDRVRLIQYMNNKPVYLNNIKTAKGSMSEKYPKYYKDVSDLDEMDVYEVCERFEVNDHSGCTHHAIKKLLLPGDRTGGKSLRDDIVEARDTLTRRIEMLDRQLARAIE